VDDNCCAVHNELTFNVYEKRWNERFGKPGDAARGAGCGSLQPAKAEMKPRVPTEVQFFTGIRVRQYPGLVLHDAPRLLDKLEELLGRVPAEVKGRLDCSSPLPGNGLAGLRAAGPENPVLPDSERDAYWSMHGLSGYIVGKARPDGQLGFIATAQQFALNFNPYVRARVVQLAAYLIDTRDLALTFRKRPGNGTDGILQLEVWSDSSALNGPEAGLSWGGGCTGVPGSGLVSWKAHAPKKPADSSGAAELIAATFQSKFTQGTRMMVRELKLGGIKPWPFNLDASSTLNGVELERVNDSMRYVAARYAMLRYAEDVSKDIKLQKCGTADNSADGFTKSLTGPALARARAQMLGHDLP